MATREFTFISGIETSQAPTASDPTLPSDPITLGFADARYVNGRRGVTDLASLKSLDPSDHQDADLCLVISENKVYRYQAGSSDAESSPYIIQPNSGSGRWFRIGELDTDGNLTVPGNLVVEGDLTTVSTTNLDIEDKNITINKGGDDASSEGAGITVERSGADASLVYEDALSSKFKIGSVGSEAEVADISSSQSLTNKTIDADNNTISNLAHGAEVDDPSSGVHGVTGNVVGTTDIQTLTNKTLTDPSLDASAVFDELGANPATPGAGTRKIFSDAGGFKQIDSAGLVSDLGGGGGGSGSGELNTVANPNTFAGDWANSGTMSSATTTTAAELPLEGIIASAIKLSGGAVNDYTSYRYKMPDSLKNRLLAIKWEQLAISGYTDGDFKLELYTNAASDYTGAYTEVPLTTDDDSDDTPINDYNGAFRTAFSADESEYYEIRFVRTSGTSELVVANVVSGPGSSSGSALITKWKSFTPTWLGYTNTSTSIGYYRRVGESMEFMAQAVLDGAVTADAGITIPEGLNIDGDRVLELPGNTVLGHAYGFTNTNNYSASAIWDSSTTLKFTNSTGAQWTNNVPANWTSGNEVSFRGSVPIAEWSGAGVVNLLDSETDAANTRFFSRPSSGQSIGTTTTTINFGDVEQNVGGHYDGTNTFTAPVAGLYSFSAGVLVSGAFVNLFFFYKNGTGTGFARYREPSGESSEGTISAHVYLEKGDTIVVRLANHATGTTNISDSTYFGGHLVSTLTSSSPVGFSEATKEIAGLIPSFTEGTYEPVDSNLDADTTSVTPDTATNYQKTGKKCEVWGEIDVRLSGNNGNAFNFDLTLPDGIEAVAGSVAGFLYSDSGGGVNGGVKYQSATTVRVFGIVGLSAANQPFYISFNYRTP